MADQSTKGRGGRPRKKLASISLLALAALGGGWLAAHEVRAAGEWISLGGINGADAYRFDDGPTRCYVVTKDGTAPAISCVKR